MHADRAEPILPSRNLDETRAFYGKLGFKPWFNGNSWPGYEIMSRGNIVMHFFAAPEGAVVEHDAGCYWRVANSDQFYEECAALALPSEGIPRLTPICDQPWGMREFALIDPSGNLVRVGQELNRAKRASTRRRWSLRRSL